MEIVETIELSDIEKEFVLDLWNFEYPAKVSYKSIAELCTFFDELQAVKHYFLREENESFGWAFTFTRDNVRCFGLTIDSAMHRRGYGKMLLDKLKEKEGSLTGWAIDTDTQIKLNGSFYKSPLKFYTNNGFDIFDNIRMYNGKVNAVKISYTPC